MSKNITIAICTYNRSALLKLAIESVINQTADKSKYDILIIDNNSTDNTEQITKQYIEQTKNIRYIKEYNQGLSFARNRAYKESHTEYVGYIDDDAKSAETYIDTAISIIKKFNPDIFGGPIYPYYLHQKPEWFKDEYELLLPQKDTGWMPANSSLNGSNMIFRKSLLEDYNGFDPNLGMIGEQIKYGEETSLIHKVLKDNKKMYYSLELIVYHIVAEFKTNLLYYFYRYTETGLANYKVNSNQKSDSSDIAIYNQLSEICNRIENIFLAIKLNTELLKKNELPDKQESIIAEKILLKFYPLAIEYSKAKDIINAKPTIYQRIMKINLERVLQIIKRLVK